MASIVVSWRGGKRRAGGREEEREGLEGERRKEKGWRERGGKRTAGGRGGKRRAGGRGGKRRAGGRGRKRREGLVLNGQQSLCSCE